MKATARRWARSLRFRLLAATLVGLAVALLLAGGVLGSLFREHVLRQFQASLTEQLDQLTAQLEFDAAGRPRIDSQALSDPRWQRPYSGLYWQIDEIAQGGQERSGVLRSRSLWDTRLQLQMDALPDGALHVHEGVGPQEAPLLLLERAVRIGAAPQSRWRLVVAGDLQDTEQAVQRFTGVLVLSLAALLVLLALAAWAQVAVGLRPLRALQRSLQDVHQGHAARLQGVFPQEVQPLVNDFNQVLERNAEVVARARTHAGNLAHALKTPLAVLDQATAQPSAQALGPAGRDLAQLVQEQLALARRHVDWHLAQARVAATQQLPGQRTAVAPVVAGLVRVMERVYAGRGLVLSVEWSDGPLFFAGEEQDLQEMLGNLLDNACKWAHAKVCIRGSRVAGAVPARLLLRIEDDGPGIGAEHLQAVVARGVRLDEAVPGTGLGLAIVQDLVALYGGRLQLQPLASGGLAATLELAAAASAAPG